MKLRALILLTVSALALSAGGAGAQTILATYSIEDHASGLAWDGQYLWYGRYGTYGERIHKFDPQTGITLDYISLTLPGGTLLDDAYGLTWDGQYLWVTSHTTPNSTFRFDTTGTIISQFANPSNYMSGLAWNGTDLYMADYYQPDGAILKVATTGTVLENWPAPDLQPWDLAWDGATLWMCDYNSDMIYRIDPVTHQVLFSFETPGTDPAGLAWDGQYLWVCDEGEGYSVDFLYKIDPFGGGTPAVQLSASSLNYGFVPFGSTPSMTLAISNTGNADLSVTGLPVSPAGSFWVDPAVTLPLTVNPGASTNVGVYFGPTYFGQVSSSLEVQSNDPIHPSMPVSLEGFGIYPEPAVEVSAASLNFGSVWVAPGDGLTGQAFEIYNQGSQPLNLASLTFNNPVFYATGFQPGTLASMDTLKLTVWFGPTQTGPYNGQMTLVSSDPQTPSLAVPLSGTGVAAAFNQGDVIWQYYTPEPTYSHGFNSVKSMDDVNNDGVPEMLGANDNYLVFCWNGQSAGSADVFWTFDTGWDPLRTGSVAYPRGMVSTPDLNGDGIGDVAIGTAGGSRSVFAISGANGQQLWSYDTHMYGDGGWVYEVTCEDDWNNDGVWDVLAAVGGSDSGTEPECVLLLSGVNGALLWRAHLAQQVHSVRRLDDVDNDGYDEVVCGASNNSQTYFVRRLDGQTGAVDWVHEVDGVIFSLNRIEDLNGDNIADVAVAASYDGSYALSGADGSQIWHTPNMGTNYYLEVTGDVNGSGYDDVLLTSVSGTFYALEGQTGAIIWSAPFGSNVLCLAAVPDVTGDGIPDACCGIMSGSFQAVNGATGAVLFSYSHGTSSSFAFDAVGWLPDIDHSNAVEFVGGARDGYAYCFGGGTLAPPPPGVTVTLTPAGSTQVPPGGSFNFNGVLHNPATVAQTFDAWNMVRLPNQSWYGPVLGPLVLTLPAQATVARLRIQNVPAVAPPGVYWYEGRVGDYPGTITDTSGFAFTVTGTADATGAEGWACTGEPFPGEGSQAPLLPSGLTLSASPNPFNPTTSLRYQLPALSRVSLKIYDTAGREIRTLVEGWREAGTHEVTFDGSGLVSGVYLYRLTSGNRTLTGKMVMMK